MTSLERRLCHFFADLTTDQYKKLEEILLPSQTVELCDILAVMLAARKAAEAQGAAGASEETKAEENSGGRMSLRSAEVA